MQVPQNGCGIARVNSSEAIVRISSAMILS